MNRVDGAAIRDFVLDNLNSAMQEVSEQGQRVYTDPLGHDVGRNLAAHRPATDS